LARRFWKTLRLVRGGATSRYDWAYLLQDEWPTVAPLLRSTGTEASRIACPSPAGEHCPRRVRRWKGTIVAVCSDPEFDCEDVEVTREDLTVLEVDVGRLAGSLCRLLNCEPDLRPLHFAERTWCIGWYEPIAGERFTLCLAFPSTGDEAHSAAVRLVGHLDRPFILFVPAHDVIDSETVEYLRRHRARPLFLEEVLTVDSGTWHLQRSAEDILREFRLSVLDQPRLRTPTVRFPTPPGTPWQNVTIRFLTQHQVHVQVGHAADAFHFMQLGMQDGRKNPIEPDRQWGLLVDFAEGGGTVRWRTTNENRRRQKQKEVLSKMLRAFFGISDDPFEPLEDRRGWRAKFRALPEE
jgi:hypothetical protein